MTVELSEEAAKRLLKLAEDEAVEPAEMVEVLIAAEVARREVRSG